MKKYDIISSLFYLGVGLFFVIYSRSVDIGTSQEPGAGFLPFYGGLLLIGMSVLFLIKSLLSHLVEGEPFFPEKDSWKRVSAIILSLIGYNLLLKPLGLTLVTFVFVGFLVKVIFPQSWVRTFIVAALSALGVKLLFINLLEIQFSRGFLGF